MNANESTKRPAPAPGQIWRTYDGDTVTLGAEDDRGMFAVPNGWVNARYFIAEGTWTECIGVVTPHGRVMVGERRHMAETPRTIHEIVRVQGADVVTYIRGGSEARWPAKTVARWSLVTEEERKPDAAKAQAALDAITHDAHVVTLPGYVERIEVTVGLTDPRAEREQRRREIDAVLREDARRWPTFATARRAAVMAAYEMQPNLHHDAAPDLLTMMRGYEDARGASRVPWERAADPIVGWGRRNGTEAAATAMVAAYERNRGRA